MLQLFIKKDEQKREKQTRYLSQAIQLEEAVNPHIIRATMGMISIAILCFIIWSAFTKIDEVARTPGEVVPSGYQKTVQHLDGGMVKTIHVHEGQIVAKDELLLTLSGDGLNQDYERVRSRQVNLEVQIERLRAYIEGRDADFSAFETSSIDFLTDQQQFFDSMLKARQSEADIIEKQITEKEQSLSSLQAELKTAQTNLKISNEMYARRKKLNSKGYASDMQLLTDRQKVNDILGTISRLERQTDVARTQIQEYEQRLASLSAGQIDDAQQKLDKAQSEATENQNIIDKLQQQRARLDVRAPINGLVKGFAINTVGAVIQPGQSLMDIIPTEKSLEVEVKISPQDIGHVKIGQSVQTKFSTYDFSRYGFVMGKLTYISATTFSTPDGGRFYKGKILLNRPYVGADKTNIILPGMTVMADVITGEKTVLQYLLKPIHLSLTSSFTER